jgi:hypothetical protein
MQFAAILRYRCVTQCYYFVWYHNMKFQLLFVYTLLLLILFLIYNRLVVVLQAHCSAADSTMMSSALMLPLVRLHNTLKYGLVHCNLCMHVQRCRNVLHISHTVAAYCNALQVRSTTPMFMPTRQSDMKRIDVYQADTVTLCYTLYNFNFA